MTDMNRRLVLVGGAAAAGTVAVPTWASASTGAPKIKDPFQLGVASGDPLPDSVVLWTRLAPAPLNPDGFGGMPDAAYDVEWEIAKDSQFSSIVQRGKVTTTRAKAHSVHAEPTGLQPGTEYFYRFKVDGNISPFGRTRTAPALGASVAQLKFAIASGHQWEDGWYHAYRGIAEDKPDLVLFLSDYVSVQSTGHASVRENAFAAGGPALAMNRGRYAQEKTDANLQAAHAAAPWVFIGSPDSQAFYEHMPIRSGAKSYRQFLWGNLARFHVLDTQRYRSDESLLGAAQEQWLLKSLETHPSTWDFLAQQVFFASRDDDGVASSVEYTDSWNGYAAARRRLTQGWVDRKVPNPVVLTGDAHKHWAADLRADYFDHTAPVVGSELVASSITSDPGPGGPPSFDWFSRNPHVKYHRNQRGYIRVTATAQQAQADFVVVSDAAQQDAAKVTLSTDVQFVLQAGRPGLKQV